MTVFESLPLPTILCAQYTYPLIVHKVAGGGGRKGRYNAMQCNAMRNESKGRYNAILIIAFLQIKPNKAMQMVARNIDSRTDVMQCEM